MGKYSHLSRQEKLDLLRSKVQSLKRRYESYEKSKPRRLREFKKKMAEMPLPRNLERDQEASREQGVHPV